MRSLPRNLSIAAVLLVLVAGCSTHFSSAGVGGAVDVEPGEPVEIRVAGEGTGEIRLANEGERDLAILTLDADGTPRSRRWLAPGVSTVRHASFPVRIEVRCPVGGPGRIAYRVSGSNHIAVTVRRMDDDED